jgi:predicted nucleotidyltransferase
MFEDLLIRLGEALNRRGFPYMIIGGQAVLLYGEPRLTRDIDITLGADTDRFDDLASLSQEIGLTLLPQDPLKFVNETMVLPSLEQSTGIRVDFIFSFSPYEYQAIQRARKILFGAQSVQFAAPEDVIIHKIIAGRPRDLEDVRIILLKNPRVDTGYIRKWLKEFSSVSEEADFSETFSKLQGSLPYKETN